MNAPIHSVIPNNTTQIDFNANDTATKEVFVYQIKMYVNNRLTI